jgi:hypothetical protein
MSGRRLNPLQQMLLNTKEDKLSAYLKSNFPGILTETSPNGSNSNNGNHKTEIPESPATEIEQLFERAETYSKTTIEMAKLKALEATTLVVTSLVSKMAVVITLSLFVLVLNIGIAIFLGEILGKPYYGYFIVALFYLITGIVLYFRLYPWIKKSLSESIIKQALHE